MKSIVTIVVEHDKPISDLANRIAQRAYTIDGVSNATQQGPAQPQLESGSDSVTSTQQPT